MKQHLKNNWLNHSFKKINKQANNILIIGFIILFAACSTKNTNTSFSTEGLQRLDLSKYGKPFSIFVPDTNSAKLLIEEKVNGALEIHVGNNFAISINEQLADIELKKQDIKEDEVNKFKSYIVEKPDAIIWQSQITKPEFHFLLNLKIGETDYSFEDVLSNEVKTFNQDNIQKMFDSCSNIKENKH